MSEASSTSKRPLLLAGLFGFAAFWVLLMSGVSFLLGGGGAVGGKPIDDGSVKAELTSVTKDKDFKVDLSLKVLNKDGGIYEGLEESNFEVFEDGVPVLVKDFMPAGQGAIRLALVMDYSRSMDGRKIIEARVAARALIRLLRDRYDWLGLYAFNDALFESNRHERLPIEPLDLLRREQAWEAIMLTTGLGNGSPMLGTMKSGIDSLAAVSGRKVMIVLTDGLDTGEADEIEARKNEVIAKCNEAKIPLFMVSTSSEFEDEKSMRELADQTGGRYIGVPDPANLKSIFEEIGKSLQNEYTMSYVSPNPVEDGQRRTVTVNVRNGLYGAQVEGGYTVAGVAATGGGARASGGGVVAGISLGTMGMIFVVLTGVLGLLSFVPNLLKKLPTAGEETAGPAAAPVAAPVATPVAGAAAPAIRAGKPPMPPPPPRRAKP